MKRVIWAIQKPFPFSIVDRSWWAHHVESTSIRRGITSLRRRPNSDEFSRHFRVRFRCNFNGRKIHVVSTYFFWCSFAVRKMHVVSTYFFRCNFADRNIHVVFTYFFRRNFDEQRFDSFLVRCKLMKTFEKVFAVFVTLNSWLLQDCSLYIFQVNLPGVAQFH